MVRIPETTPMTSAMVNSGALAIALNDWYWNDWADWDVSRLWQAHIYTIRLFPVEDVSCHLDGLKVSFAKHASIDTTITLPMRFEAKEASFALLLRL